MMYCESLLQLCLKCRQKIAPIIQVVIVDCAVLKAVKWCAVSAHVSYYSLYYGCLMNV